MNDPSKLDKMDFFFREIVSESQARLLDFLLSPKKYFVKSTFNSLATFFFGTQYEENGD